jgi:hypothetical protein
MKKVIFAIIAIAAISFASCKKCTTCYYKYKKDGNWDVYIYPEECGKKKDIEQFKNECKATAASKNSTCTCNEK